MFLYLVDEEPDGGFALDLDVVVAEDDVALLAGGLFEARLYCLDARPGWVSPFAARRSVSKARSGRYSDIHRTIVNNPVLGSRAKRE